MFFCSPQGAIWSDKWRGLSISLPGPELKFYTIISMLMADEFRVQNASKLSLGSLISSGARTGTLGPSALKHLDL